MASNRHRATRSSRLIHSLTGKMGDEELEKLVQDTKYEVTTMFALTRAALTPKDH